jgi:hypothetical protein
MMNLMLGFCQSKSRASLLPILLLIVVGIVACSRLKIEPDSAQVQWNDVDQRFSYGDEVGRPIPHLFFDLAPFINLRESTISAVVLNYQNSTYDYGLDTMSGQIFRRHRYCKVDDIFGRYDQEIYRPPFTWGVVPRLLDPLGQPQKVVIFGGGEFFKQEHLKSARSHRIRIVGGLIDRYCPTRICKSKESWDTSLILVGVDLNDPSFRHVVDLGMLKKKVNWNGIRSFLENGRGVKLIRSFVPSEQGSRHYVPKNSAIPAFKIGGESGGRAALEAVLKQGHLFDDKEMTTLRNKCHKLYDLLWTRVESIKNDENGNVGNFIRLFYKKYRDRFYTCSKFVRPANINIDQRRHWFFSYMTLFFKLNRMEYHFLCRNRSWAKNHLKDSGKMLIDLDHEIKYCNTKNLDFGIRQGVGFVHGLYKNDMDYLRYIEYDQRHGGSHQKIYNWVNERGVVPNCRDPKEVPSKEVMGYIFPSDVSWESLLPKKHSGESLIIRVHQKKEEE